MTGQLEDETLLRTGAWLGGHWVDAARRYAVHNPATGGVVAEVACAGAEEARRATDSAAAALPAWSAATAADRAGVLRAWADGMRRSRSDLAALLTAEQGKPLAEARAEVDYAAAFLDWFAEEGRRAYGEVVPSHKVDARILVLRQPVGVVAAITPWNFPLAMVTRKLGPALAAGCTVVLKPSEETPLSAHALAVLAERAGLPAGAFNIVSGDAPAIGAAWMADPRVRKVSFTGSTRVGKLLMRQASDQLKKLSLELGGNAPFIVFDDADIEAAVAGAIASKFRNGGQTCVSVNRFYIQDGVYERFTRRLADAVAALRVGPGDQPEVQVGPLINRAALDKVQRHMDDAVQHGGRVLCGGRGHALGGTFYEPTVLVGASAAMAMAREETFGPVAACYRFRHEDEVLALANDTDYGLAAYFYTRDLARAWHVAERLEVGMVGINEGLISTELAPFGGIKESGLGREGSRHGLADYMEIKYLLMGGLRR